MKKNVDENLMRADLARIIWRADIKYDQLKTAHSVLSGEELPMEAKHEEKFLNLKESMRLAGNVSRTTFYRWTRAGLRRFRVNRRIMFLASDIKNFITNAQNGEIKQ